MVCIDMRLIQIQRQQWPSSEISSEIRAIFLEENIPFDFDAINTLIPSWLTRGSCGVLLGPVFWTISGFRGIFHFDLVRG
jgi:hypothetical protein